MGDGINQILELFRGEIIKSSNISGNYENPRINPERIYENPKNHRGCSADYKS